MFCGKCGKQLPDTAKFCSGCGNPVGAPQEEEPVAVQPEEVAAPQETATQPVAQPVAPKVETPAQEPVSQPEKPKKKPNKMVGIAVVAVAAVAIIALLVSLIGGGAGKVAKALGKSLDAYMEAYEDMKLPDLTDLMEKQEYSADVAVWVDDMEDAAVLEGMGVRVNLDYSLSKREFGLGLVPYAGAADIVHAQLKMDDSKVYVGVPEITGETFYMVDTTTIFAELEEMGAPMDGMEELSINIFDIIDKVMEAEKLGEDAGKDIEKAVAAFVKTIEVEKDDADTIEVNGTDLKCKVYHVEISQEALENLVDAIEEAYASIDTEEYYKELLQTMNLPKDVMDEMEDALADSDDSTEEVFDSIRQVLDVLGDVELDLYLNDGYVVAAVYEEKIEGTKVEITLNLGGNENYVDDFSLQILVDGENEILLTSTGNHTGKGGEFTDETVLYMTEYGERVKLAEMEMTYAPKEKKDNFSFSLNAGGMGVEMEGQLAGGTNSMELLLEEVEITEYGYKLMTLGIECNIGKYDPERINTKGAVNIGELTQEELMEITQELSENATEWATDLQESFPQLMYFLY